MRGAAQAHARGDGRAPRERAACATCSRRCGAAWSCPSSRTSTFRRCSARGDISTAWTVANLAVPPSQPGVVADESAGGGVGREPRRRHRVGHRVSAGTRRAGRRRHRALGRMEFLFGHRSFRLEPARVHRARRRQAGRLRVLPAAPVAVRGDRRLAHARHARDEQQDRALQGRLRSGASRDLDVPRQARSHVARAGRAPQSRITAFRYPRSAATASPAASSATRARRSRRRSNG